MTEEFKQSVADRVLSAIKMGGLTKKESAGLLDVHFTYLSYFSNKKLWNRIGEGVWNKFQDFVNSGYSLQEWPKHRGGTGKRCRHG
jgi:hypothetical protein